MENKFSKEISGMAYSGGMLGMGDVAMKLRYVAKEGRETEGRRALN